MTTKHVLKTFDHQLEGYSSGRLSAVDLLFAVHEALKPLGQRFDLYLRNRHERSQRPRFQLVVPPGDDPNEYCAAMQDYFEDRLTIEPRPPKDLLIGFLDTLRPSPAA